MAYSGSLVRLLLTARPPAFPRAGLECGVIGEKYSNMDSISIGPTVHDVHTPKESLEIASVEPFCKFLLRLLAQLE